MSDYYDELETRSREERDAELYGSLPEKLQDIAARIPAWQERLRHDMTGDFL